MKKLRSLALLCTVTLGSCAEAAYRADVGAMFPIVKGKIALQNASGSLALGNNQNDIDSNMGLGDTEVSPYVHLQMDTDKHRVRVHGFMLDSEGSGTLSGAFGEIAAGSQVTTSMDFYAVQATYAYQLFGEEHWRLAIGAALGGYGLDVAARSASGREEVETSILVPMPYFEGELFFGPVLVGADAGFMGGDFGDGDGNFLDAEGYVKVRPTPDFEIFGGYRYIVLDAFGNASGRDFDADLDIAGFFLGGGIRF
jgi:hypothetical protein